MPFSLFRFDPILNRDAILAQPFLADTFALKTALIFMSEYF
jgi:hypothetical protein